MNVFLLSGMILSEFCNIILTFHGVNNMKKTAALLLCLVLLCSAAGFAAADTQEDPMLCLTAEYGRLYQVPLTGGDAVLLADAYTACSVRDGDSILASFNDGTVRRINPADGSSEVLVSLTGFYLNELYPLTGGFVGISFSMREGMRTFYYNASSGSFSQIFEDKYVNNLCSVGKLLIGVEHNDMQARLVAYEFPSGSKLLETPVESSAETFSFDGEVYVFYPNAGKLDTLDISSGRLTAVDIPLKDTDYDLRYIHDGRCIVHGNYLDDHLYLIRDGVRQVLEIGDDKYPVFYDAVGKYALFYTSQYLESTAVENSWYSISRYYVLDMESGTVTEIPVQGQYGKLFENGDFPVMDSSTARKPVTAMIYSFFCESTGAGGSAPLCSTTHYAWLNIADGTADIALLAAPTQEEQDYLNEKGVSVEMKLYGGDGLVFIGNHACGVDNLTLDQVRAIYRGEITNWAEVGGTDHPIRVLYRDDQSGSQRLFESMLWKNESVPDLEALGFDRLDDMSSIVSQCLYDPYTIGYSIMTYLNDVFGNEDLLAFSLDGYEATPENVAAKNYPLSTQGYVVIRSDEAEDSPARRLFNWFGSPLSDYMLQSNGITPLN